MMDRPTVLLRRVDMDSLTHNPFLTREDLQRAIVALCAPVEQYRSEGGARIRLNGPRATYTSTCQEMEGFARLLWGIAPLVAGGAHYRALPRICEGLINGCDPNHAEYWGTAVDLDQRLVEYAALAFAIIQCPDTFWAPMSPRQRGRVATFLAVINDREVRDNNWLFFRVLVNLALARCDAPFSPRQLRVDLDRLDAFYAGDGWYVDGCNRAADYYCAFGMHFYGLLCAAVMRDIDPARAQILVERATAFAEAFVHWFSTDGSAIPYGRSLTYRFAPAAFWGALALAGVEPVPWGVIKGLVLRHLRWWFRRPIVSDGGLLPIGYAYPNQTVAERYTSPCSPYWALKSFLPVALPGDAPFWRADEQDLPTPDGITAQPHCGMLLCRDGGHVFALAAAARVPPRVRHVAAKYGKFCYSSHFGFSLPASSETLQGGAHDSSLTLSEPDDRVHRTRDASGSVDVSSARIVSHWTPWPDVFVTTWLVPAPPWHVRVHRIRTARSLNAAEGGFALGLGSDEPECRARDAEWPRHWIGARTEHGVSVMLDLRGQRYGEIIRTDPNTNVIFARAVVPTLHAELPPGEHVLACAVAATVASDTLVQMMATRPTFLLTTDGFEIGDEQDRLILREALAPAHAEEMMAHDA